MTITYLSLIILAIFLNCYGQIMMKWQLSLYPPDTGLLPYLYFLFRPWVISAFLAVFLGALLWLYALAKIPLNTAYPIMGLSFIFILLGSWLFFNEPITPLKIIGNLVIFLGVAIATR